MTIRATVFGENVHEQTSQVVRDLYPNGMHSAIADALNVDPAIEASWVTLQMPEHGLTVEKLAATDVLVWWGHAAHGEVKDEVVERIAKRVWEGMGLLVLHSGHFSKIFKRLMGTPPARAEVARGGRARAPLGDRSQPPDRRRPAGEDRTRHGGDVRRTLHGARAG